MYTLIQAFTLLQQVSLYVTVYCIIFNYTNLFLITKCTQSGFVPQYTMKPVYVAATLIRAN